MIDAPSGFFASSIPVAHNAVKSIIFRCAELLMGLFMFKFFSLAAARSSQFTSYLMFGEDFIQRCLFMSSRGLSGATILVLVFTVLSTAASLYGTLLWALDSPGYVFQTFNSTVADYKNALNPDAPYIVQLRLDRNNLDYTEKTLNKIMGTELFKSGYNVSLTGDVKTGKRETTPPTQQDDVGARIWLDSEGFSVSADTYILYGSEPEIDGHKFPFSCIHFGGGVSGWNCTMDNVFAQAILETPLGRPEVHYDDVSSKNDSKYINPNRQDNVWASYGKGGGTTAMMQVFTVTKGSRRHTFIETFFRATMLNNPGIPFAKNEVDDLVRRAAGWNATSTKDDPFLSQIIYGMLSAQDQGVTYTVGTNFAENEHTVIQNSWSYFTPVDSDNEQMFSIIHTSTTNITLIRSEDIASPPAPLEKCDKPFQNEAFGGKVTRTNCAGATMSREGERFYGTVDTAAVMILHGLGAQRSNISSESLDQEVVEWVWHHTPRMLDLLVARGFAVSVDPSLVGVSVDHMIVAVSGLQLFLSVFAGVLAIAAWAALSYCADDGWSKSVLANLVHTTLYRGTSEAKKSYMEAPPNVDVVAHGEGDYMVIGGKSVVLWDAPVTPVDSVRHYSFSAYSTKEQEAAASGVMVGWGAPRYQYAPVPQ